MGGEYGRTPETALNTSDGKLYYTQPFIEKRKNVQRGRMLEKNSISLQPPGLK